jgi:Protein of unknown function (DUF1761)
MEFCEILKSVNYLHVLVATLAYFGLGAFWYMPQSPIGKIWMRETNTPMEGNGKSMPLMFGTTLVITFIICTGVAIITMGAMGDLCTALEITALAWLFFSATTVGMNYLYQGKSITLYVVDGLYQLCGMLIAATILTLWA